MGTEEQPVQAVPLPSPLSDGVVNEEGQLRCLRNLGPNLGDSVRLLPPSPRSAGRPVPTIVNRPSARPRLLRAVAVTAAAATTTTVHAIRILYLRLPANCRKLISCLNPAGPIRTVRSFGLGSDLELSHLSMSSGRRLVQTVPRGSSHLPLPERWTHSGFPHTVLILAGSLLGKYGVPKVQPLLLLTLPWSPSVSSRLVESVGV